MKHCKILFAKIFQEPEFRSNKYQKNRERNTTTFKFSVVEAGENFHDDQA